MPGLLFTVLYFENRNYALIYAHTTADKISNRLIEIFTGVYFFSLGMPLYAILLFFGLEFGFRGVVAPWGAALASRIGPAKTMALSYVPLLLFFSFVASANLSLFLGFSAFVFQSISRGLYYPCFDSIHSTLVEDKNRGQQFSLEIVLASVAGIVATTIGTIAIAKYHYAFLIVAVFFVSILASLPVFFLPKPSLRKKNYTEAWHYLTGTQYRENWIPFTGQALAVIANIILVPLLIYILAGNIRTFGSVMILILTLEMIATLLYGAFIDKRGHARSVNVSALLVCVGNVGYALLPSRLELLFVGAYNQIVWNAHLSAFNTRQHKKGKRTGDSFIFNTATQMNLCFVQVIWLSLLSMLAYFTGIFAFTVAFSLSIAGLFLAAQSFKD